jgi:hypothetical protein
MLDLRRAQSNNYHRGKEVVDDIPTERNLGMVIEDIVEKPVRKIGCVLIRAMSTPASYRHSCSICREKIS